MATVKWDHIPPFPLNFQQRMFCRHYVATMSTKQAAIRAGYSPRTALQHGSRLLTDPRIAMEIKKIQDQLSEDSGITPEKVLQELALIAFSNIKDVVTTDENGDTLVEVAKLERDKTAALGEVSIQTIIGKHGEKIRKSKAKGHDKLAALQTIAKLLGMVKDKVEHSGTLSLEEMVLNSLKKSDAS